jgi:predicted alpha/beta hydrolase family esterase
MSEMPTPTVLMLPGLGNSGPAHWQSLWEQENPNYRRVHQRDWEIPDCTDWVAALNDHLTASQAPVVVVAHSLACALVAQWVSRGEPSGPGAMNIAGALLVSPSDVDSPAHTPPLVRSFSPIPLIRLPFPSIVVASADDPYVDLARARRFAGQWSSRFVNVGAKGHINAASGLGDWPEGKALLATLLELVSNKGSRTNP